MITMQSTSTPVAGGKFKLMVEVLESTILPIEVFLYKVLPDGTQEFSSLCSIHSLVTYPNVISVGSCLFRKNSVELLFSSAQELINYLDLLKTDLKKLEVDYTIFLEDLNLGSTTTTIIE